MVTSQNLEKVPGHQILALAGKTKLRPGGVKATETLLKWANFQPEETVLELASGFGESAIQISQRFGVRVIGIEKDATRVARAQERIKAQGLEGRVEIRQGDIFHLDEIPEKFDYVFAEAILSMQSPAGKAKILEGISQRLKQGGKFLSHELLAENHQAEIHQSLSQVIRVNTTPLSVEEWNAAFQNVGLTIQQQETGEMGLLSFKQMLRDEGLFGTMKFGLNLITKPMLRQRVLQMQQVFQQYSDDLGYIATCAEATV